MRLGDVNKVTPIDKSSTVLTMILALIFLGEKLTAVKIIGMVLIGSGTFLMIEKKKTDNSSADKRSGASLVYAMFSAVFAALTSIFGKIGIEDVESNLGTAIRTVVVLLMAWILVFAEKKQREIKDIDKKSWLFLVLSGFTTGGSWLCYYGALKNGPASIIAPIDKLSIVVTVAFSYIILKEKLSKKACKKLDAWRLLDCEMYVTLEPCPMCCGAIINSRIERVIFGAFDSKSGSVESIINMFDLPFNHKPKIVSGIMQKECSEILSDFFTELRKRLKNKKS